MTGASFHFASINGEHFGYVTVGIVIVLLLLIMWATR